MRMKSRCSPAASRTVSWFQNTVRSEEHTSELQSRLHLVCRLLLEKKKNNEPFGRRPGTPRDVGHDDIMLLSVLRRLTSVSLLPSTTSTRISAHPLQRHPPHLLPEL